MKKWMTLLLAVMMLTMSVAAMAEETVKTGTSYNEVWGETIANVVEKDGQIEKIVIDVVRGGASSKEQFDNYGVKPLSSIGKDWWEQVAYYENWVQANGVDAAQYDENGHALDADLIAGCTINISNFNEAVSNALNGVEPSVKVGTSSSDVWGETIANIVEKDGVVEKIVIDVVRDGATSKEQHDNYGVKPLSSIGKEWWEQVMYYEDWVLANGVDAVEYDENGHALNADLISGCTINITNFTEAVKAAQGK